MNPVPETPTDDGCAANLSQSPSSEVGFTQASQPPTTHESQWQMMFELQQRNMVQLIEAMKSRQAVPTLPEFNPDSSDADARAWCSTIDICMAEQALEGGALIIALSKSLKGSASSWLSQVSHSGMTWTYFKELFLARYDSAETIAAALININNGRPKEGECMAAYASRLMTSLIAKWKNLTAEEIAISYVLAHTSQFDTRLHRLACTTEISNRSKLLQEMKSFSYLKRKLHNHDNKLPDNKRFKPSTSEPLTCNYCGKVGHKIIDCRKRKFNAHQTRIAPISSSAEASSNVKKNVICFTCGEKGHIATQCSNFGTRGNSSTNGRGGALPQRRVDYCEIQGVTGQLEHSGESYSFYFDSGAECSLIKLGVASKFSGTRYYNSIHITGIGNSTLCCTEQIQSDVVINGNLLSILFHILPDKALRQDVMIGRDILKLGYTITMTDTCLTITKLKEVDFCEVPSNFNFYNVDSDISSENKQKLVAILNDFSDSFVDGLPKTRVTTGELNIRLINPNIVVQRRPYRLSPDERQVVRTKINELLQAKIIRPSCSPFSSPILLVKKRDGSDRMCVDYRELNRNTVPDRFPLPLISDLIARLSGANFFTCLDCASGFNLIPVSAESVERTAFVTPDGQYEYLTMPFGLRNAPSVFQRAASNALGSLVYSYAVLYMDDILIPSLDENEGLERLREILEALTKAGFSLNILKCSFLKRRVEFLGYEISAGEVRPNPRKVEALTKLPPPENVHQLRQFIGLASYFRKFVSGFSQIMIPLFHLISSKVFVWKPEHEKIRKQITFLLTNKPVLMIFNPELPTELHTDASAEGYGGILFQKDDKLHVVEHFSRRTTNAESKYHSYELETLAVVNAVKHFRHYLYGRHFTIVTDCNSLKSSHNKLDLTPRVHRWWAFLQAFDFEIVYRPGKLMSHVDFLSRNPLPTTSNITTQKVDQKRVDIATLSENWLLAEQIRDSEIQSLVSKLKNNDLPSDDAKTYEIRSGVLFRKVQRNNRTRCLPIVPRAFRWSVVNHIHEAVMHLGWEKTLDKLYDHYWFDYMSKYVRKFVENCITCKVSKSRSGRVQAELHPIPKVCVPWHTLHVDITGKLSGKNDTREYVIVFIDAFTKFVLLYHTLRIDTPSVKA